jgi:hypothetical protein
MKLKGTSTTLRTHFTCHVVWLRAAVSCPRPRSDEGRTQTWTVRLAPDRHLGCSTLHKKALRAFETSSTEWPTTQKTCVFCSSAIRTLNQEVLHALIRWSRGWQFGTNCWPQVYVRKSDDSGNCVTGFIKPDADFKQRLPKRVVIHIRCMYNIYIYCISDYVQYTYIYLWINHINIIIILY